MAGHASDLRRFAGVCVPVDCSLAEVDGTLNLICKIRSGSEDDGNEVLSRRSFFQADRYWTLHYSTRVESCVSMYCLRSMARRQRSMHMPKTCHATHIRAFLVGSCGLSDGSEVALLSTIRIRNWSEW